MNSPVSKYQTQQVMTASPARLVCMLYDRAILSLKEAVAAIEAGQIEARWRANKRATDIIAHMWTTLDAERGGEIAANLGDLFKYMLSRLPAIDFDNDPAPAHEVIRLLEPLRESWHKVANGEVEIPTAQPAPPRAARPAAARVGVPHADRPVRVNHRRPPPVETNAERPVPERHGSFDSRPMRAAGRNGRLRHNFPRKR